MSDLMPRPRSSHTLAALALSLIVTVALVGCSGNSLPVPGLSMPDLPPPPTGAPRIAESALQAPRFDSVAVAGGGRTVDDNAVAELRGRLEALGTEPDRLHVLTTNRELLLGDRISPAETTGGRDSQGGTKRPGGFGGLGTPSAPDQSNRPSRRLVGGVEPANEATLLSRIVGLDGRPPNGACLVYLVGTMDGGSLSLGGGSLDPTALDRALGARCADAPTVVVVSACASGAFAGAPMARPGRVILTAGTDDRKGFGCGPNYGYTTFDECFLGTLDGAADWGVIIDRTRHCVTRREALVGQPIEPPSAVIGAAVAGLAAPWRDRLGPQGVAREIGFRAGIGRFDVDGIPYYPTLKRRLAPIADGYRQLDGPKALALTFAGTMAAAHGESQEEAARLAIQLCEWQSSGACVLFALGEVLAAPGASGLPPWQPSMLARSGSFDPGLVPFISDKQRNQAAGYAALAGPKAMALAPEDGRIGIATGPDARAAALARCGAGCVPYAEGDRIVLGWVETSR